MRDMIDLIQYFNENKRDFYWNKKEENYKFWFKKALKRLKNHLEETDNSELDNKYLNQIIYRLDFGYHGIGVGSNGLTSGIITEDASVKGVPTTKDHVLGATDIGKYIHEEFEKYNFDFDYMVDEWLYENLWLWMTIKVTKEEHRKDNIIRNEHSIEDKLLLKHYKKVSNLLG